jgi:hypothetical protein
MSVPAATARRQYLAYGTAIVLVIAACFGARLLTGEDNRPAARAVPPASPTVTVTQYSDVLASADAAIGTDFRRLDTTSAKTLASAVPIAAQTMYAQAQALRAVHPPAAAAAPHQDLIAQLSGFSDMIQRLGTDQATPVCPAADTSQYDALLRSGFAQRIRADVQALARANKAFVFGTFLPPAPALPTARPATGAYIRTPARHGSGILKITNGGAEDTAVSLVPDSGGPLLTVYVRGGTDVTVPDVATGTYRIYYQSGRDWNPRRTGFMTDCAFSRFDETYAFRAYPVINTWEISMTPVAGGNASTSEVDPESFPG